MYTLYLDGSGDPGWCPPHGKSTTTWYLLGGVAIENEHITKIDADVNNILSNYSILSGDDISELKYSALISGNAKYGYDNLEGIQRKQMADEVFSLLFKYNVTLFSVAVNKNNHYSKYRDPHDPNLLALRFVITRYDLFLKRLRSSGTVIMDSEDTRTNKNFDILIEKAKREGVLLWGEYSSYDYSPNIDSNLHTLDGRIGFSKSDDSPGIQLADFCSHAVWRSFERGQKNRFSQIQSLFDSANGKVYGLKIWP